MRHKVSSFGLVPPAAGGVANAAAAVVASSVPAGAVGKGGPNRAGEPVSPEGMINPDINLLDLLAEDDSRAGMETEETNKAGTISQVKKELFAEDNEKPDDGDDGDDDDDALQPERRARCNTWPRLRYVAENAAAAAVSPPTAGGAAAAGDAQTSGKKPSKVRTMH